MHTRHTTFNFGITTLVIGLAALIGACSSPTAPGNASTLPPPLPAGLATQTMTIRAVSPDSGPGIGRVVVQVTGTNFQRETIVTVDGIDSRTTFVNSTILTVVMPAHEAGLVDIAVHNRDGQTAMLSHAYNYTSGTVAASRISPAAGTTDGGLRVAIGGAGFQTGAIVSVDGVRVSPTYVADIVLSATMPAHPTGHVEVVVTNPDGESAMVPGGFEFVPPETLNFNGTWDAYPPDSENPMASFTIVDNKLTTVTCGSGSSVIALTSPVPIVSGRFAAPPENGAEISGRILSADSAIGEINVPSCWTATWFGYRR
jgi:hypothetical protein